MHGDDEGMGCPTHLDKNAILCGDTGADHYSGGGGQGESAWAGHNEHSNAKEQGKEEGVAARWYPLSRERPCLACRNPKHAAEMLKDSTLDSSIVENIFNEKITSCCMCTK